MVTTALVDEDGKEMAIKGDTFVGKKSANDITTAGAGTYTAAQVLAGIIVRDCNGGSRTDTLPTATDLVGAMLNPRIGEILELMVINGSDAAETITIAAGTGGSFNALQQTTSKDIAQNTTKRLLIRITGIAAGSQAYVVYM